jgi:hypothetical protein
VVGVTARLGIGLGINLTEQSNIVFGTWFTYDFDGTPLWLSVTANNDGIAQTKSITREVFVAPGTVCY